MSNGKWGYRERNGKCPVDNKRGKNRIIRFLKDLVRVPSTTGSKETNRVQKIVAAKLEEMDMRIDVWEPDLASLAKHPAYRGDTFKSASWFGDYSGRPNVVGTKIGVGKGKSLIFNGHIDVVPADMKDHWRQDPWKAGIHGNRIYGRGTADMKGGVAAMIMALYCIQKTGITLNGDVLIQSVVEEEYGGGGTLACIIKGYKADAAIVAEPTFLEYNRQRMYAICPASRGCIPFKIRIRGKGSHLSQKHLGVNAISKFIKIYEAFEILEQDRENRIHNKLFEGHITKVPLLISVLRAGIFHATVPPEVVAEGDMGYLPNEKVEEVKNELSSCIDKVARSDPWLKNNAPSIEWVFPFEAYESDLEHPLVDIARRSFSKVTGNKLNVCGFPSSADARLLALHGNVPAYIFGPGTLEVAHSVDESISIDEVLDFVRIYALMLLDWSNRESPSLNSS